MQERLLQYLDKHSGAEGEGTVQRQVEIREASKQRPDSPSATVDLLRLAVLLATIGGMTAFLV